jgi:hypothetical protein
MHSTIEKQQERSREIKLLIAKWVKRHGTNSKVGRNSDKYPKAAKKKMIDPSVSRKEPALKPANFDAR